MIIPGYTRKNERGRRKACIDHPNTDYFKFREFFNKKKQPKVKQQYRLVIPNILNDETK